MEYSPSEPVIQVVMKLPTFYGTKWLIAMFNMDQDGSHLEPDESLFQESSQQKGHTIDT
jgi:hypothetical protein